MFAQILLIAALAAAQSEQTVPVQKGVRLDISNFSGNVVVRVWDRDAVRVVGDGAGDNVDITAGGQVVAVRSGGGRGRAMRSADCTVTVPSWMPINVNGMNTDVTIDGAGADVAVETVRGDIKVDGGSGFVRLRSVQGEISLTGARGRVEARSYNQAIRLAGIAGEIAVEAINGAVTLSNIDSSNVEVSTVNGEIRFDGPIKDKGTYRLTTHNGLVSVVMTERTNATLSVRTYNGSFRSSLPIRFSDPEARRRTVTLGNGSAHVDLETFNGTIAVRRPGEADPDRGDQDDRPRPRRRQQR